MDKLIMLGTGSASARKFYNSCFALKKDNDYMLIDGGGGINIFSQLEKANIKVESIKNIFVTHSHIDHIIGIIWLIRKFAVMMMFNNFNENIYIYMPQM